MSSRFVVTLARQFGSLGRPIARTVSESLGIDYYDRDIVELAAQEMGLPVSTVSKAEESARPAFFSMSEPLGTGTIARAGRASPKASAKMALNSGQ